MLTQEPMVAPEVRNFLLFPFPEATLFSVAFLLNKPPFPL